MARFARFLVVLDVDSTLIDNEVIELLAEEAGSLDEVAEITERAMNGELDFAASLRARVATLAGLGGDVFSRARERVTVTRGAEQLIEGVHAAGGRVAVVSGGFHEVLDPLAEELGLWKWSANRLAMHDGRLTGEVDGPIIDADAKADALRRWAGELEVPMSRTVAVGDGANDIKMMAIAGLSVAFDAKEPVRRAAAVSLDERDLAQLLPLIGIA